MRTPMVGGNWKMNTNRASARSLAGEVARATTPGVEVVVFPPFPYLLEVGQALAGSGVLLGAQDCYPGPEGAFTGEVSLAMLKDCGVSSVLVGHSERRHIIRESDSLIADKAAAVAAAGLTCVLCIGETLEQRERGQTDEVNERQLRSALTGVPKDHLARIVIAYEPVWAIGTGKTATPEDAQTAHRTIRSVLARISDDATASATRIQYGGSVKASNAGALFAGPDVDGGLIGGASLSPGEFGAIIRAARR